MKTYLALSALLSYPEPALVGALPEISTALDEEELLPRAARRAVAELVAELAGADLYDLQERYVSLFDRGRALSLHLFEHVHGESRDRGQALVDLANRYRERGYRIAGNELPDYLPLFLEYLSLLPCREAKDQLAETAHIVRAIGDGLVRRGSRYAALPAALLALAGEPGLTQKIAAPPGAEDSAEALDRAWADEPVTFGGGCAAPGTRPVRFYRARTA